MNINFLQKFIKKQSSSSRSCSLNNRVLIGTHHKTGTVWMENIFRDICLEFKLTFFAGQQKQLPTDFDVFFQSHSLFDTDAIPLVYRGIHMIRDPRDRIVSGCFYHQKSGEEWLHTKRKEFDGLSYQEKLNSYESLDDKLLFEMENSGSNSIQEMLDWNYDNPAFFEVKYEYLILDKELVLFQDMFVFLGFPDKTIPRILKIAYDNSIFSGKPKNPTHIRSGKTKQWQEFFKPVHKVRFLDLFDNALIKLGYENNNDWAD